MINLTEIYTNKYRNRPATNSAQAQPEKGMRLCAETLCRNINATFQRKKYLLKI